VKWCTFFQVYGADEAYKKAVSGFVLLYCRGDRQGKCVRKEIGRLLADARRIPPNMLPNGLPLTGTDDSGWSSEVKAALRDRKR